MAQMIMGLPEAAAVNGSTEKFQAYGDGMEPPKLGFGCVRRTMMKGTTKYWGIILPKVTFAIPKDEMETQEDQIDWQTQELTATLMRDDTAKKNWKYVSEGMDTEAEAEDAVRKFLGAAEN